jgi:hypothetical protein
LAAEERARLESERIAEEQKAIEGRFEAPRPVATESFGPRQHRARVKKAGLTMIVVGLVVGAAAFFLSDRGLSSPGGSPPAPRPGASVQANAAGVAVPPVAGSTVMRARIKLFEVGLQFDRAIPTSGPPGFVVRTQPAIGTKVQPGTTVTLYVGAPPDRSGSSG